MMRSEPPDSEGADRGGREGRGGAESIELESFTPVETPRYLPQGQDPMLAGREDAPVSVPARPLHLCPACDYILTGLTSRRCPECGEPFTLGDARHWGFAKSPGMRRLYRAMSIDRAWGWVGVVLMALSFLVPNCIGLWSSGRPQRLISFPGAVMLSSITELLLAGWVINYAFGVPWRQILLVMGVIAALLCYVFFFL